MRALIHCMTQGSRQSGAGHLPRPCGKHEGCPCNVPRRVRAWPAACRRRSGRPSQRAPLVSAPQPAAHTAAKASSSPACERLSACMLDICVHALRLAGGSSISFTSHTRYDGYPDHEHCACHASWLSVVGCSDSEGASDPGRHERMPGHEPLEGPSPFEACLDPVQAAARGAMTANSLVCPKQIRSGMLAYQPASSPCQAGYRALCLGHVHTLAPLRA